MLSPGGVSAGWPKVETYLSWNQRMSHVAWWGSLAVLGHFSSHPSHSVGPSRI
eukprot:CAMPEP_0114110546 /NCGR_PEP_ID=MMETSP0043_2-20121206/1367_1 /TAXON_ID=464988 /ORGANISM="Hemiselmis andersenii, Strain CCMP644" /LENGTH=52 /DNA_ID=CAMNT_0001202497 /DNA_START=325 /DNA_END=480 /DNA_ORIENTATION=-